MPALCSSGLPPCSSAAVGQTCTPDEQCTPKVCMNGYPPCSAAQVGQQCTPDEQCDFLVEGSAVQCPDDSYPLPGQPCPNATPGPSVVSKVVNAFAPSTMKTATGTAKKWPWLNLFLLASALGGGAYAYRRYKSKRIV